MHIDRKLASCLVEIKRSLPYEMQGNFKISAPNIEEIVFDIHQSTKSTKVKQLTKEFLLNVGGIWPARLKSLDNNNLEIPLLATLQQNSQTIKKLTTWLQR